MNSVNETSWYNLSTVHWNKYVLKVIAITQLVKCSANLEHLLKKKVSQLIHFQKSKVNSSAFIYKSLP